MPPKQNKEKNRIAGEEFLAENANNKGIKTTKSGLQYEVIKEGDGKNRPHKKAFVTVHYKGTTLKGKIFDSSYKRGKPAAFPLKAVIQGWREGVQLMSVGSKYKFYIPHNLAYGSAGAGKDIGPNETLIFEIELLGFQ